jgi:hypothetical protein
MALFAALPYSPPTPPAPNIGRNLVVLPHEVGKNLEWLPTQILTPLRVSRDVMVEQCSCADVWLYQFTLE